MDAETIKCNNLQCRTGLSEKAVVTTCSHIFCVDCANELFNAARLCPACETTLSEPDDVVVCSLQPTNDYKTSVLSGLTPSIILEICSRAIAFWQYQMHQENAFQHAVVRSVNDKNTQLQRELTSVTREADSEIAALNTKLAELERDLELERRRNKELAETSKTKDKEYQKLKAQHERLKHRALIGGPAGSLNASAGAAGAALDGSQRTSLPMPMRGPAGAQPVAETPMRQQFAPEAAKRGEWRPPPPPRANVQRVFSNAAPKRASGGFRPANVSLPVAQTPHRA